jgi:hypothetical protein
VARVNAEDRLLAVFRQLKDSWTETALTVLAFYGNRSEHFRLIAFFEPIIFHAHLEIFPRFGLCCRVKQVLGVRPTESERTFWKWCFFLIWIVLRAREVLKGPQACN